MKKLRLLLALFVASIGAGQNASAQNGEISVTLLNEGSLYSEVLYEVDNMKDVIKLKIAGPMNDEDWANIKTMENLVSLDMKNAVVEKMPEYQFTECCLSLETVILPSSLKEIGNSSFRGSSVKYVEIPDNLEKIGGGAFGSCYNLEAISQWPTKVTEIPDYCFNGCKNLKPFDIPEGVVSIGSYSFGGCSNFNSSIPSSVKHVDGFWGSGIKEAVISEGAIVDSHAFTDCHKLELVDFPSNFYQSGQMLLGGGSLKDVYLRTPTVFGWTDSNSIWTNFFNTYLDRSQITIHVPSHLVAAYKAHSFFYSLNIEGFSTADVDKYLLQADLTMNNRERFDGAPSLELNSGITFKVNGDNALNVNDLIVNTNYPWPYRPTTMITGTCENVNIGGDAILNYYAGAGGWTFLTMPFDVKASDISTETGAFAVCYYDGADRAANGAGSSWKKYGADDIIKAGTGIIVQPSVSGGVSFKSQNNDTKKNLFSNQIFTKPLQVNASSDNADKGWNLVGNPWLTYYNIHKLNFTAPITCWDGRNYVAYSVIDDDYAIRPLEAFFVQCPSTEMATIGFPIDGRQLDDVIESLNGARAAAQSERKLIDVVLGNDEMSDKTRFVMNPQASMDYEVNCDASKFMSMDANAPQIWTVEQGVQMAINERPLDSGTVQIGFKVAQGGEYTISTPRNGFKNIVLVDNETGMETDLSNVDSYSFSTDAGTNENRFMLRVGGVVVTDISEIGNEQLNTENEVYDLQGRKIVNSKSVNSKLQRGLYIVNGKKVMK